MEKIGKNKNFLLIDVLGNVNENKFCLGLGIIFFFVLVG